MENSAIFIHKLRQELGCNQDEFARIMGVTPATVSRWENDRAKPTRKKWELLLDVNEMLGEEVDPAEAKERMLVAGCLDGEDSPLEKLKQEKLEATVEEKLEESGLAGELFYGKKSMGIFSLTKRKIDYWLKLAREGKVELDDVETWERITRPVVPLMQAMVFIPYHRGVELPPAYGEKFYKLLAMMMVRREIEEKKPENIKSSRRYTWPVMRMEGYAVILAEAIYLLDSLALHLKEQEVEKGRETMVNIEDAWWWMSGTVSENMFDILAEIKEDVFRLVKEMNIKPASTVEKYFKHEWFFFRGAGKVNRDFQK